MLKKYIKKNQSTKVLVGFEIRKITINNHELKIAIIMVLYTNHHTIFFICTCIYDKTPPV